MIQSLMNFFKSFLGIIKKDDIIKNLDDTVSSIQNEIIPVLDRLLSVYNDIPELSKNSVLMSINTQSKMKAKDNREVILKLRNMFKDIVKNKDSLHKLVSKKTNDFVTNKTARVRDVAIINFISGINGMTLYTLDLIYYGINYNNIRNSNLPNKKIDNIKLNISTFSIAVNSYTKDLSKKIDNLSKISVTNMYIDDGKISMLEKIARKDGKIVNLPELNGFVNNPIYHIRMWMVDREMNKYEILKDKKKLIELKILELKLAAEGEANASLDKQIEYYENKLSKIEYEISLIEEDD